MAAAAISVAPDSFANVAFDAAAIRETAARVAALIGFDRPIAIVVDETTPLTRVHIAIADGVELRIESGAFEDTRHPRQFSTAIAEVAIGRALLHALDRIDGSFAAAPADDGLSLAQVAAWDAYALGRLARLGLAVHQQRVRYNFRNRFGFTDGSDAAFDAIWAAAAMSWEQLEAATAGLRNGAGA